MKGMFAKALSLALFWLCAVASASAQDWPAKAVRIIVPFAAGATPDTIARLVADRLQQRLGQNFIVENKAGASGMTGTMIRSVGKATAERVLGVGPGRIRAAVAAMATGTATAVLTYRLLRGSPIGGE